MRTTLLSSFFVLVLAQLAQAQVQRPLPVVERLEPTSGPPGSTVIVVGRHFDDAQTLWIGQTQIEVVERHPNRWTVRIPASTASGTLDVHVARGIVNGPRFRVSQAAPTPIIASFTPTTGAPGSEVVLRGEHFSPRLTENQVHLGETPVVVRNATPTELTVIVPNGAVSAPFRVRVSGAGDVTTTASFAVGTGTAISSFEPPMGPPGTRVTIRGTGFSRNRGQVRVYLGEARARVISAGQTEIVAEIPRRDAASARLLVDVRGAGRAFSATEFRVRVPPVVAAFEPASGAPGTRITIRGEHFGSDVREIAARIGETTLPVRDLADDHVVVEIPAGATNGPIEVTVTGLAPARTRTPLTILEPPAIASFTPENGGATSVVTITGRGFSARPADDTVTISGTAAEVVRASATELQVRIPAGARSGPIVVTVANAGEVRTPRPFVVTRAPAIASFAPTSGAPGTLVTIRGASFGTRPGLLEVRLGEVRAEIRRVTDTELDVVVPENARTGPFRVTVRLEGSATSSAPFTVSPPAAP